MFGDDQESQQRGECRASFSRRSFIKVLGGGLLLTLATRSLTGCDLADAVLEGKRSVSDDAQRTLTIPTVDKLSKIYFTSASAQIFCFTLAPELLAGTGVQFTKQELSLLPAGTSSLPYLGSLSGGGEIDREALLAEGVQLIFSISSVALTESNISEADDLQNMTGIPTLLVDGSFEHINDAYRFLGKVLGKEKRAEEIAIYCEDVYQRVNEAILPIPQDQRVTFYYAEGPSGLQTEPSASQHALAFVVGGAKNVAQVEIGNDMGMSSVSLEQVLLWDPEVIVSWDFIVRGGADQIIRTSSNWKTIKAVKNGRVYTMPNIPFAWCDRPPSVNRFLGIQWIANMLYPQAYDVDMVEVTKEFYSKLYWADISDDKAKELLGNSYPPYQG